MKMLLIVLGLALIAVAAVYFLTPANALPSFFPGYDTALTRMRMTHGIAAAVAGVVALGAGWWMGRR